MKYTAMNKKYQKYMYISANWKMYVSIYMNKNRAMQ